MIKLETPGRERFPLGESILTEETRVRYYDRYGVRFATLPAGTRITRQNIGNVSTAVRIVIHDGQWKDGKVVVT